MGHLNLTDAYCAFIDDFRKHEKLDFDPSSRMISESIFYHVFRIKHSLWLQMESFGRKKRIATSDLLQDIIAYYLRAVLPDTFEVLLEQKIEKLQPDILIRFNDKNIFILEIKTTIGWNRSFLNNGIEERIISLSEVFKIPTANIIYIFQSPWNVNVAFRERYWNAKLRSPAVPQELEFPYNQIRPLFSGEDPFYYMGKDIDRVFTQEDILGIARNNIVVPFENTIVDIFQASSGNVESLNRN